LSDSKNHVICQFSREVIGAHFVGKMVETASIKGKIISFHNDSTSLCGLRKKTLSEQLLLKIANDPAQEVKSLKKGRRGGTNS
jgi:hypothetical protein